VFLLMVDCGQCSLLYCLPFGLLYDCRYVSKQCGCAPARNNTHACWRMLPCVGYTSRAVCKTVISLLRLITLLVVVYSSSSPYSVVYFTWNRWWGRYKGSRNRIKVSTF